MRNGIALLMAAVFSFAALETRAEDNGLTVINKGALGGNSVMLRERFQGDVLDNKPDFVLIYVGINDTLNDKFFVPLDKYLGNLKSMTDRAKAAGIKAVVCTMHRCDEAEVLKRQRKETFGDETPNGKMERYNAAIRKFVAEEKVGLADFGNVTAKVKLADFVNPDGVHLIPAGNQLLAQTFFDVIAPQLKGKEKIVCVGDSITFGYLNDGGGGAELNGQTYPSKLRQIPLTTAK
jgi:lysophospholipase L1-like esterase